MKKTEQMSSAQKRAGWIGSLLLFGAVACSLVAMFQGNLWWLAGSALLLIGGVYWIRKFMSGQFLS